MKHIFDEILGSKGKVRILLALIEKGESYLSQIARDTKLSNSVTLAHLKTFCKKGIVKCKKFGRMKFYSINTKNENVNRFIVTFMELNEVLEDIQIRESGKIDENPHFEKE